MSFRSWLEDRYPFDAKVRNRKGEHVPIYINPTFQELHGLGGEVRMWLDERYAYAWGVYKALHFEINQYLKLQNGIPIVAYYDEREIIAVVSDASDNTKWHENPQTAKKIKNHPYMKKMWKKITVNYYNEDVVGDWEKINKSSTLNTI